MADFPASVKQRLDRYSPCTLEPNQGSEINARRQLGTNGVHRGKKFGSKHVGLALLLIIAWGGFAMKDEMPKLMSSRETMPVDVFGPIRRQNDYRSRQADVLNASTRAMSTSSNGTIAVTIP